ncbi:hypothetical protein DYY67_1598 [Candidatus Nitrosotalea sp. TS]|nr:hypothetical protein [Candidatus Nitrosotalea sp. TS]
MKLFIILKIGNFGFWHNFKNTICGHYICKKRKDVKEYFFKLFDKFFRSELDLYVSDKTIDRSIKA